MTARELIALLRKDGWAPCGSTGGHDHFKHPAKPGKVTVARHGAKDIPKGTLNRILKDAGLK